MKLGFFTMPVHPLGRNVAETLEEDRQAFILADRLGYSEAFCGEHLTDLMENIPNSMIFLASLADATRQIRLGTGVTNLPHSHPVLVATSVALLDHLLKGRFILGVGPGIVRSDAESLGVLDRDRRAMFVEALDHVKAIWASEGALDLKGDHWKISTARTYNPVMGQGGVIKPLQQPHPPFLGGALEPGSKGIEMMGQSGWLMASGNMVHANWLPYHWESYAKGAVAGGREPDRENWRVARSIFVGDDDASARAYVKSADSPYRFYMNLLFRKLSVHKMTRGFKSSDAMPDEALSTDSILDDIVISGGVTRVVDAILALHEKTGGFGTLLYAGKDWNDPALARRSMELMAEKVMPAVNSALRMKVDNPAAA